MKGIGIGLRSPHIAQLLSTPIEGLWLELLADNWLTQGGLDEYHLQLFAERYPLSLHTVGMSLGGTHPIDKTYLSQLKRLLSRSGSTWLSDHLCFSQVDNHYFPDLLPLPFSEETIKHVAPRIREVQDFLEMQIAVENVSSYLEFKSNNLDEADFINALCEEAGCQLLLDINNLYVTQRNHGHSAQVALQKIDRQHIREIHLAGHRDHDNIVIDTHDNTISDAVWQLYRYFSIHSQQPVPTLIEWDTNIPELDVLLDERDKALHIQWEIFQINEAATHHSE